VKASLNEWPAAGSLEVRRVFGYLQGRYRLRGWEARMVGSAVALSPVFRTANEAQRWVSERYDVSRWQRRGMCSFVAAP
jgi:hypothetical protein